GVAVPRVDQTLEIGPPHQGAGGLMDDDVAMGAVRDHRRERGVARIAGLDERDRGGDRVGREDLLDVLPPIRWVVHHDLGDLLDPISRDQGVDENRYPAEFEELLGLIRARAAAYPTVEEDE